MTEKLELERTKPGASEAGLTAAANDVVDILRQFDSPKDAVIALAAAHRKILEMSFPPEFKAEASKSLDNYVKGIRSCLEEGWQ